MRLVTFGCSFTYGYGLEDCWDHVNQTGGPEPSKFSWPYQLAQMMGLECVNRAKPGSSNKFILHRIQEFDFHPDDTVIVMWTFLNRFCIIKSFDDVAHITVNRAERVLNIDKAARTYYKHLQNDFDDLYNFKTYANFSKMYLDKLGIKNYHTTVNDKFNTRSRKKDFKWDTVDFLSESFNHFQNRNPKSLDDYHPGSKSHYVFARAVFDKIIQAKK